MNTTVYTTQTGDQPGWKRFPEPEFVESHDGCVHSIGFCAVGDWD